jgi:hypothetical protein
MQMPTEARAVRALWERISSTCVETFTRRIAMDEKRMARLFGLTLGGLFAISLILSAITI